MTGSLVYEGKREANRKQDISEESNCLQKQVCNPTGAEELLLKESFWTYLDTLLQSAELVIDRPRGSSHPRYPSLVYPLDYGYLKGTSGGDGNELDVWRGTSTEAKLDAIVCTVDLLKRDVEVKLLVGCTEEEKITICDFHNDSEYMAATLLKRRVR
jgi:inorganic pyrophosphatase